MNSSVIFLVIPGNLRFVDVVLNAIKNVNIDRMVTFVDRFDNFPNRYFNSQNGVDAADWLEMIVKVAATDKEYGGRITVTKFSHSWPQNSIIARIEGKSTIFKFGA